MSARQVEEPRSSPAALPAALLPYASFFAGTTDGALLATPGGQVVFVNDAAQRILGASRGELVGPLSGYPERLGLRAPDGSPAAPVASRALAGEIVEPVERLIRTPDGQDRRVRTGAAPLHDASGGVLGALILVTEARAASSGLARPREEELALRESEARYRMLFDSIDEGFCLIEVLFDEGGKPNDYRYLEVNRAFERQSGLVDVAGKRVREFLPSHEEHWFEVYGRVALTGEPVRFENRAEGLGRWFDVYAFRIGDPSRRTVAVLFNDITARRHAEEALREADQRKTEFLGVLSHELRNPLAPIRNSIDLLDRVPANSPQATRARQVVRRQTEQLAHLVDDLLDVTRISRGKIQLHREVLDLCNVVRRTCEDHRSLFDESEIDLRLELPAGPVQADVDPTRLAQVVGNLLHNANKFTHAGGVVTVGVRVRDGRVEIRVRDTGIGMEPGRVSHMFEPFTQEERSLARTRGGLGLGLALAKGLVELHGGTIDAHSEGVGKGSEFVLTLPLAKPAAQAASTPAPVAAAQKAGPKRKVLIIEDNMDAALTLADVLELDGFEVRVARDGTSGIALARQLRPDVILCDIGLPDVDGYEVARALREDESLRSTRLIALSGYAQPEDKLRAGEAGFDAHVSKPTPLDELSGLIN